MTNHDLLENDYPNTSQHKNPKKYHNIHSKVIFQIKKVIVDSRHEAVQKGLSSKNRSRADQVNVHKMQKSDKSEQQYEKEIDRSMQLAGKVKQFKARKSSMESERQAREIQSNDLKFQMRHLNLVSEIGNSYQRIKQFSQIESQLQERIQAHMNSLQNYNDQSREVIAGNSKNNYSLNLQPMNHELRRLADIAASDQLPVSSAPALQQPNTNRPRYYI